MPSGIYDIFRKSNTFPNLLASYPHTILNSVFEYLLIDLCDRENKWEITFLKGLSI